MYADIAGVIGLAVFMAGLIAWLRIDMRLGSKRASTSAWTGSMAGPVDGLRAAVVATMRRDAA